MSLCTSGVEQKLRTHRGCVQSDEPSQSILEPKLMKPGSLDGVWLRYQENLRAGNSELAAALKATAAAVEQAERIEDAAARDHEEMLSRWRCEVYAQAIQHLQLAASSGDAAVDHSTVAAPSPPGSPSTAKRGGFNPNVEVSPVEVTSDSAVDDSNGPDANTSQPCTPPNHDRTLDHHSCDGSRAKLNGKETPDSSGIDGEWLLYQKRLTAWSSELAASLSDSEQLARMEDASMRLDELRLGVIPSSSREKEEPKARLAPKRA